MISKTKEKLKNQKNKIFKNESFQFTLVNPKTLLRPYPDPKKISRWGPKRLKMISKSKNKKVRKKPNLTQNESYQP